MYIVSKYKIYLYDYELYKKEEKRISGILRRVLCATVHILFIQN